MGTVNFSVQTHRDQAARHIQLRFYDEWLDIPHNYTLIIDIKKTNQQTGRDGATSQRQSVPSDPFTMWAGANPSASSPSRPQEGSAREDRAGPHNATARGRSNKTIDVRLGLTRLYPDSERRGRGRFRRVLGWTGRLITGALDWHFMMLLVLLAILCSVSLSAMIRSMHGLQATITDRFYSFIIHTGYQRSLEARDDS